jgi:hypothetical protein
MYAYPPMPADVYISKLGLSDDTGRREVGGLQDNWTSNLSPKGEVVPERLRYDFEEHLGKDLIPNTVESFRADWDFNSNEALKKMEDLR